ncbi:MAG: histidinol-phosphatase HisJ [Candidatus Lokiarchaeota archaeon]|nr:histidinol-phosphatase HisJ [Candidatus Lokiarchaeota archaeon]
MQYEDWHTHNALCRHAIGSVEDYILKGIQLNLNVIGSSDHFPYEYLSSEIPSLGDIPYEEYAMPLYDLDSFILQLENLREKYADQIHVRFAFEIDYFKHQDYILNKYLKKYIDKLDYILGSVHVLFGKAGTFAFDDGRFLNKYKEYEVNDEIYLEFYNSLQEMIKSPTFELDIVTHFDLPKKFDKRVVDKDKVMEKVIETLELVKKHDLTVEINTSGLRKKVKEQYPSIDIIHTIYDLDIPILLGSDAHKPEEVGYEFQSITKMLKNIGFTQFAHYKKRSRSFIDI